MSSKSCRQQQLCSEFALQVTVPPDWIDAIFPGVRRLLEIVQARNARLQSGKGQADDLISDRAAEGFLQTVLYSGICFWQNLPFKTQRYVWCHKVLACCSSSTKQSNCNQGLALQVWTGICTAQTACCCKHHGDSTVSSLYTAGHLQP